jgi:hypothetical protein
MKRAVLGVPLEAIAQTSPVPIFNIMGDLCAIGLSVASLTVLCVLVKWSGSVEAFAGPLGVACTVALLRRLSGLFLSTDRLRAVLITVLRLVLCANSSFLSQGP